MADTASPLSGRCARAASGPHLALLRTDGLVAGAAGLAGLGSYVMRTTRLSPRNLVTKVYGYLQV
jgi:hypothetical protein